MKISNIFKTNTKKKKKKNVFYSTGDWHAKARSQEIPRIKGKFGLEVWNEAGQMVTEFCQENTLVTANNFSHQHETDLHVDIDQIVNIEIRLIMFFTAEDGEALHSQ